MKINPKLQQQVEQPSSRAGSENGKRKRIEESTEQPDLDVVRTSVSPTEPEPQGDLWEFLNIQQL